MLNFIFRPKMMMMIMTLLKIKGKEAITVEAMITMKKLKKLKITTMMRLSISLKEDQKSHQTLNKMENKKVVTKNLIILPLLNRSPMLRPNSSHW